MRVDAVVLAGGTGSRMRDASAAQAKEQVKKQYLELQGRPMICHSLATFEAAPFVEEIALVVSAEDVDYAQKEIVARYGFKKIRAVVAGGKERYHSVYNGLRALNENGDEKERYVMIHDGARPYVAQDILRRVLEGVSKTGACVAAMPVKDTIKQADENHFVTHTPDRRTLWMMQTPQAFSFPLAYQAYDKLIAEEASSDVDAFLARLTDDAMVVERYFPSQKILLVEGAYSNLKITTPDDLPR